MNADMNHAPARPLEPVSVTDADVISYLAATRPGIAALGPELFADCKAHLQREADAGRLSRADLDNFKTIADSIQISPLD